MLTWLKKKNLMLKRSVVSLTFRFKVWECYQFSSDSLTGEQKYGTLSLRIRNHPKIKKCFKRTYSCHIVPCSLDSMSYFFSILVSCINRSSIRDPYVFGVIIVRYVITLLNLFHPCFTGIYTQLSVLVKRGKISV